MNPLQFNVDGYDLLSILSKAPGQKMTDLHLFMSFLSYFDHLT